MTSPVSDAWLAWSDLAAMLQSSAFPADEYDQPDCQASYHEPGGHTLTCTRAIGHTGRHLAAVAGHFDGTPLFAIAAAWPGTQPPKQDAAIQ